MRLLGRRSGLLYAGGGSPPPRFPGLVGWYDAVNSPKWQNAARTTPAVAAGDHVDTWDDRSGQGNHVTQSTDASRFILAADDVTGALVMRSMPQFADNAGSAYYTIPAGLAVTRQAFSVFFVCRQRMGYRAAWLAHLNSADNNTLFYRDNNFLAQYNGSSVTDSTLVPPTNVSLLGAVSSPSAFTIYQNGASAALTAMPSNAALTGGDLFRWPADGSNRYTGDVKHVLIYNRALSAGEVAQLYAWSQTSAGGSVVPSFTNNLVFIGDSLTAGYGDTDRSSYPSQIMLSYGAESKRYFNLGRGSYTVAQMATDRAISDDRYSASFAKNLLAFWGGTNDLFASVADATVQTRIQTYCSTSRSTGYKVVVCTLLPRQDASTPVGFETSRLAVNVWIRANWASFADALADVGADASLQDPTNTTYYNADKVHLKAAGSAIVAGLVKTQLDTL